MLSSRIRSRRPFDAPGLFRAVLTAGMLAVVVTSAQGATLRTRVEFDAADLRSEVRPGIAGPAWTLPGSGTWNQPGAPAVPFRSVYLAVPEGEAVVSVSVRTSAAVPLDRAGLPGRGEISERRAPAEWDGVRPFPETAWSVSPPQRFRGVLLQPVTVWPVRVDPSTGRAALTGTFDIEVTTAPAPEDPSAWRPLRRGTAAEERFGAMLERMVANPEVVREARVDRNRLRPADSGAAPFSPRFRPSVDGSPVEMVIITGAELASSMELLADWKTERGIPTVVRTTDWIRANYPNGVDLGETLRRFIADAASRWGTEYVLLAGDSDVIPIRYGKTLYFGGEQIPADMYYQCLDGTWNADGDAHFGEGYVSSFTTGDGADLLPEVWLGRAAVTDSATAAVFVAKTLAYEKNPAAGYLTRSLFMAEVLFPQHYSPGDSIIYDGAYIAEQVVPYLPNNFSLTRLYENYTAYPGALPETKASVTSAVNLGYGVVQHVGHGYINTMAVGIGGEALDNGDAMGFTNGPRFSVLYSINCTSAAIDFNCIGEKWLENPNGGAVANIGSTRFDFPGTGTDYQNEFYRLLFDVPVPSLGEAFAGSKLPFVAESNRDSEHRWTQFAQILLGDPSLRVWRHEPATAVVTYPPSLELGTSLVPIQVTLGGVPVDSAVVCLHKEGDDYEVGLTDALGMVTLSFRPDRAGAARLTVTAPTIRPFQADIIVAAPAAPHLFASLSQFDDATVPAIGNGDSIFDLNETVRLDLVLENSGTGPATGITATLVSTDPNLQVLDNSAAWPNLNPGAAAASTDGFLVRATGTATDRYETSAMLHITAAGYTRSEPIVILVGAPLLERYQLTRTDVGVGDGDGVLEVGENQLLTLTVRNNGRGTIRNVVGKLRPLDAQTTIVDSVSTYGNIGSGIAVPGDGFVFQWSNIDMTRKMRFVLEADGQTVMVHDIDVQKPAIPALPVGAGKASSIALTWTPLLDTDLRGYVIYRSTNPAGPFTRVNGFADSKIAYYNDELLPPLTRFYYRIAGIDQSGNESTQSATAAATTTLPSSAGFPLPLGGATSSSPTFSYFDGDTIPEIVTGAEELYVVSGLGTEYVDGDNDTRTYGVYSTSGYAMFWSPPSSSDIDLDGVIDVAAAGWSNGLLYVYDGHLGTKPGFPVDIDQANTGLPRTWSAPVMVDVDGDGILEIFINSAAHTYAFRADGTEFIDGDNNPATTGIFATIGAGSNYSSPRIVDLDNDGQLEVVIASRDRKLFVKRLDGTNYPGWPMNFTADITSTPAIGDLNNDGLKEIVFGCSDNKLYAVNINQAAPPGWPKGVNFNQDLDSSPALADINGDGFLDVAVCAGNGTVYIFRGQDGGMFPGYPVILTDAAGIKISIRSSPSIGDVDTTPDLEIVFGGQDGNVYALKSNGQMAVGFPIKTENVVEGGPLLWDLDGDGLTEVCVHGYDQKLYVWDTPAPFTPTSCPWPMFGHDSRRTGVYGSPIFIVTGTPDGPAAPPAPARLLQNAPNPFQPRTSIRFDVAQAERPVAARLTIFDLNGRAVRRLLDAPLTGGDHEVQWDGRNDSGEIVGSGVYFYRLEVDGYAITRKMTLAR